MGDVLLSILTDRTVREPGQVESTIFDSRIMASPWY